MTKSLSTGFSIIICTYNGANKIIPTLEHLGKLNNPEQLPIEIIFVDNNSTDDTTTIVVETWKRINNPSVDLILLNEEKPGKYFALQQATQKARYEYFIICDDDNWLDADYIINAYKIMKDRPDIGALGGFSEPVFENTPDQLPSWFIENPQMLAMGNQGKNGDVTSRKQLWGAGLVARTAVYRKLYQKYPSFFISPGNYQGHFPAEDTEFCVRLILKGYKLYYDDSLRLQHFVPNQRLEQKYFDGLKAHIEKSFEIIFPCNFATKLYGTLAMNKWNKIRLRVLNPFRMYLSKQKNKHKYQSLQQLFYPKDPNTLSAKIKAFAEDPL